MHSAVKPGYMTFLLRAGERLGWLLLAFVAGTSLMWPLGWDQGIFASVGRVIAEGGVPYRDAFDIKGPVTHYVYALTHFLFGTVTWGIRVVDMGLMLAAALVLRPISVALGLSPVAVLVVYLLWYASGTYWHTAQPDAWAGGLLSAAIVLSLTPTRFAVGKSAAAGALIGATSLIKPHYAGFLVLPLLAIWLSGHARVQRSFAVGGGWLFVIGAAIAWFAAHGAVPEFVDAYILWPTREYASVSRLSVSGALQQLMKYLLPLSILLAASPAIVLGAVAVYRERSAEGRVLLAWAGAAVMAVVVQRRFFDYHWTVAMPPLVLLASVGVREIVRRATPLWFRGAAWAYLALLTLRVMAHPVHEVGHGLAFTAGFQSRDSFERHFGIGGVDRLVSRSIADNTTDGDFVIVFGPNAGIGYLSGRPSPSRFVWNSPLLIGEGSAARERFRREYIAALTARTPAYIVESTETGTVVPDYQGLEGFPELSAFLNDGYVLERRDGHLNVYRRIAD